MSGIAPYMSIESAYALMNSRAIELSRGGVLPKPNTMGAIRINDVMPPHDVYAQGLRPDTYTEIPFWSLRSSRFGGFTPFAVPCERLGDTWEREKIIIDTVERHHVPRNQATEQAEKNALEKHEIGISYFGISRAIHHIHAWSGTGVIELKPQPPVHEICAEDMTAQELIEEFEADIKYLTTPRQMQSRNPFSRILRAIQAAPDGF